MGRQRTLQLVNAPLSPLYKPSIRSAAYPPLHLVCLANHVGQREADTSIEILDGEVMPLDDLLGRVGADMVGISANTVTYDQALRIARVAKQRGATVVLGGNHATFAGGLVIQNQPDIDFVVQGDGEEPLLSLMRGHRPEKIPNLWYRTSAGPLFSFAAPQPVRVTLPDYRGVDLEPYFLAFRSMYPDKPFRRGFVLYSAKGCQWRDKTNGGCVFCAIQNPGFQIKSPADFWDEVLFHQETYGADFFWDVSDTFTMQRDWILELARIRPANARARLHVYARSSDIDDELASALEAIGVYEVFIGVESGNNSVLKVSKKGTTAAINRRAVRILDEHGFRLTLSVVLGLPGESVDTVRATVAHFEELVGMARVEEIHVSLLMPLPGAPAFHMMLDQPALAERYLGRDLFNWEEARRGWLQTFCDIDCEELLEAQQHLLTLAPRAGSFGRLAYPAMVSANPLVMG